MNRTLFLCVLCLFISGCGEDATIEQGAKPGDRSAKPGSEATPRALPPPETDRVQQTFREGTFGTVPANVQVETGAWELAEDATGRGLLQTAQNPNEIFNVALIRNTSYGDVDISVRVGAVSGSFDQGGGPVWRARDAQNYYVARWNPLEENYRLYKIVAGVRTQLATADVPAGSKTRQLRVKMVGDRIRCWIDDERLLDLDDGTFSAAGSVGLWTKADARTLFSDMTYGAP